MILSRKDTRPLFAGEDPAIGPPELGQQNATETLAERQEIANTIAPFLAGGIVVGAIIGVRIENLAIGVSIGIGLGILCGAILHSRKSNKFDGQ